MNSRRSFLKTAGVLAAGAATSSTVASTGCAPSDQGADTPGSAGSGARRVLGFDRSLLDALGDVVLPVSLGADGRRAALDTFVAFVDAYDPVAEEMHGYGYADVRYLPSDPAPAWRAQLAGLDLLAMRSHAKGFARLDAKAREQVVTAALRGARGDRLPAPLQASHVALALLSHWASSPAAWDLALGARVTPNTCRVLNDATSHPVPIARAAAPGAKS